jgi:CheY-like chemotaxis protein
MNILIVDDSATNRMLMHTFLDEYSKSHGIIFNCSDALDGQDAVNQASETAFDLVLMDIMMPVMDGVEATKQIQAMSKKPIILAISATNSDEQKSEILNSGAADFLAKPVSYPMFQGHLEYYISVIQR